MYDSIFIKNKKLALTPQELIERLKKTGIDICPYHYVKYIANKVNLLLCPYNYILSPIIRKIMDMDIKDKIIVFDEAHNIENLSEESCSLKLSIEDL